MIEPTTVSEAIKYLAGLAGGVMSLRYADDGASRIERTFMACTGFLTASFCTPAVQSWMMLSDDYTHGISFLLGLYGWSLTGGIMRIIKSKALAKEVLKKL